MREGFLVVRKLFSTGCAQRLARQVLDELDGQSSSRRSAGGSPGPSAMLEKVIETPDARAVVSDRYRAVIDALCGAGRWRTTGGVGHWPVIYPDSEEKPWRMPTSGWHFDGARDVNRLGDVAFGLIGLELFTPIESGGGGTAIRRGSHRDTARALWKAGEAGIPEPAVDEVADRASASRPVYELTGQPGDVCFLHPYTLHAASRNTGSETRVMAHRPVWLFEPMDLSPAREGTPIERAVQQAIDQALN